MAMGPGKYDVLATIVRTGAKARGVALIVIDGMAGSGFSVQMDREAMSKLPELLDEMAKQIREDLDGGIPSDH